MEELLKVVDVAKILNVHRTTIDRAIRNKTIDHYKMGKNVRFSREHIEDFKNKSEIKKTNDGEK